MATQVAIEDLNTWLQGQPENIKNSSYEIEITGLTTSNIGDIKTALINNTEKYVDLRETTIPAATSVRDLLRNCVSLIYPPAFSEGTTTFQAVFRGCSNLKEPPALPNTITTMEAAFQDCKAILIAPVIPEGVVYSGGAFLGCTSLKYVPNIPSSIYNANRMFEGCGALEKIEYFGIANQFGGSAFKDMFLGCTSLYSIGFAPSTSEEWHLMKLDIGTTDFKGKIFSKDKTSISIPQTSFTKEDLKLPVLTDELWFPPTSMSDTDIEDVIDEVLTDRVSYWNKDVLNPGDKTFVLLANDPDSVITNLELGGGEDSPLGSIQAYYGTTDPVDKRWLICDGRDTTGTDIELATHYPSLYTFLGGTNVLPDLREVTLVGAGQNGTDTIATHDVYNVGQFKDDQIQNITGKIGQGSSSVQDDKFLTDCGVGELEVEGALYYENSASRKNMSNGGSSQVEPTSINFDASRSARTGTTTHGKQKGVNYIIKAVASTDTYEPPSTEIQQIEQYVDEGLTTVRSEFNTKIGKAVNYSTTEQWTGGYWTNGKKIYRKSFIGLSANLRETWVQVATITNIEHIINCEAVGVADGYVSNVSPYTRVLNANGDIQCYVYHWTFIVNTITFEYTKSTD